jgi:head-tail adaptor
MPAETTRIAAGELRHRVKIIDPRVTPTTQDTFGGRPATGQQEPTLVADNLPAKIEFRGTGTFYSAQQAEAQASHLVTIRWMPGIVAEQQVYFLDFEAIPHLLQIRAINPVDHRNIKLVLECLERPDLLNEIVEVP